MTTIYYVRDLLSEFKIIGHRGAAGLEPENTLLSIEAGIKAGANAIEIDVYAVEEQLIVIHDDRLERTTDGHGYVQESRLSYLRTLNAGKGQKIPLLSEVIEQVNRRVELNVELKGAGTARPLQVVLTDLLAAGYHADDFLVSSFNHHELSYFHHLMPAVRIGALTSSLPLHYAAFAAELDAYAVHPAMDFLNEEFLSDAHSRGLKVYTYTVNYAEDIERLEKMGVDGVFTDYPPGGKTKKPAVTRS